MKAVLQYFSRVPTVGRENGTTPELVIMGKSYKKENLGSRIRKDFLNNGFSK